MSERVSSFIAAVGAFTAVYGASVSMHAQTLPIPEATSGFQAPITETNVGYAFDVHTANDYICTEEMNTWVYHTGRDMNAATWNGNDPESIDRDRGTPVLAAATGRVVYANADSWGGIVIQHSYRGATYYTQYGHIQNP